MNRSTDPERREPSVRRDDLTRDRQYRGVDPSGYESPPRTIEQGNALDWREEAPGNRGEPGGRWHDHEMPYSPGRPLVGLGDGVDRSTTIGQPHGGLAPQARELYPDPAGKGGGYGHGGREGPPEGTHAPEPPVTIETPSDAALVREVCRVLGDDGFVDARDVEVRVEAGEVILEGTVSSEEAKRRAEDLALGVGGARDVVNRLRVETIGGP